MGLEGQVVTEGGKSKKEMSCEHKTSDVLAIGKRQPGQCQRCWL